MAKPKMDAMAKDVEAESKKMKKGGMACRKTGGRVEGKKSMMRLDRPGRKTGGRVGADTSPLSAAANTSTPAGRSIDKESDGVS